MTRFNCGFDELLRSGWNRAWWLVSELMLDPYSHTNAAISGWGFVPSPSDVQFYNWVDAYRMMHTIKGQVKPQPVKRPWEAVARKRQMKAPTAQDMELRNRLKERLGVI